MNQEDIRELQMILDEMKIGYCTSERGFRIVRSLAEILLRVGTHNDGIEAEKEKTMYVAYIVPDKVDRELLKQAACQAVWRVIQEFKNKVNNEQAT
jgi:hypothetical protein